MTKFKFLKQFFIKNIHLTYLFESNTLANFILLFDNMIPFSYLKLLKKSNKF